MLAERRQGAYSQGGASKNTRSQVDKRAGYSSLGPTSLRRMEDPVSYTPSVMESLPHWGPSQSFSAHIPPNVGA